MPLLQGETACDLLSNISQEPFEDEDVKHEGFNVG